MCSSDLFCSSLSFELPRVMLHATKAPQHFLILSNKWYIGLPVGATPFHASRMTPSHSECDAHLSSNHFGFLFLLSTTPSTWCTLARGKMSRHLVFAQARSSLSWTKALLVLPFLQVKILPVKPRSINPQCSSALLKSSIHRNGLGIRPCFSSDDRISL